MEEARQWKVVLTGDTIPGGLDATFRREGDEWTMTSPAFEALTDPIEVWNLATRLTMGSGLAMKEVVQRVIEPKGTAYVITSPFSSTYIAP